MSFTLRDRHLLAGELPIQALLDAATEVITEGCCRWADRRLAGWLFQVSLRAVCEAIVECGYLPLPLAVRLQTCRWKDAAPTFPELRPPQGSEACTPHPA